MSKTDYNLMMNEVSQITRRVRKLARQLNNEAAVKRAETFEQEAGNAYRNRNAAHLETHLLALRELEVALQQESSMN